MSALLRAMKPADLDAVVSVFLECWRGRYSGMLPDSVVDEMTEERARGLWAQSEAETVVAVDDSVVGVSRHGRDPDGEATLLSLYVSPPVQGGGVGRTLLRSAESALAESGADSAVLWVFAANAPSIGFYRRHGWAPDGATRVEPEWPAEQIRLRKSLRAGDAA